MGDLYANTQDISPLFEQHLKKIMMFLVHLDVQVINALNVWKKSISLIRFTQLKQI